MPAPSDKGNRRVLGREESNSSSPRGWDLAPAKGGKPGGPEILTPFLSPSFPCQLPFPFLFVNVLFVSKP